MTFCQTSSVMRSAGMPSQADRSASPNRRHLSAGDTPKRRWTASISASVMVLPSGSVPARVARAPVPQLRVAAREHQHVGPEVQRRLRRRQPPGRGSDSHLLVRQAEPDPSSSAF
jgi:hypothetical protein